jgi:predicted phage tail component-like protein
VITLDGIKPNEIGLNVLRYHQNPVLPGTIDRTLTIPGVHGQHDFGSDLGPKYFEIPLGIKEQKNYAGVQKVINTLNQLLLDYYGRPKLIKLVFEYEPDKFYWVKYSGSIPIERLARMGEFILPLVANDPMKYAFANVNEIHWDSATVTFDDTYSIDTVFVDGVRITSSNTLKAYVNGLVVRPTILINGSGNNVTFQANGKSFSLTNFTNAQWEIRGNDYTVWKNGVDAFKEKIGVEFIELLPGINNIQISGQNMNFELSIVYRDCYM